MHLFSHHVDAGELSLTFAQTMARQIDNDDPEVFSKPSAEVFPDFSGFKEPMKQYDYLTLA